MAPFGRDSMAPYSRYLMAYFCDIFQSHEAAQNAAMIYSFLGTCKMNGIEPFEWLKQTITKIPDCKISELEKLLPISQH